MACQYIFVTKINLDVMSIKRSLTSKRMQNSLYRIFLKINISAVEEVFLHEKENNI